MLRYDLMQLELLDGVCVSSPMAPIVTKLMAFNLQALDQRKKDLSKLEKRTGEMVDAGSEFADLAGQLLQKYKH